MTERERSAGNEKKKDEPRQEADGKGGATHADSNKKGAPTRFCKREGTRAPVREVVSKQKRKRKGKREKKTNQLGCGISGRKGTANADPRRKGVLCSLCRREGGPMYLLREVSGNKRRRK